MGTGRIQWQKHPREGDPVIWVDLRAFDLLWQNSDDYVGFGGAGSDQPRKYENVGKFICRTPVLWHPHVGFDDDYPAYSDGRHRTAWLRDHGAAALPISCNPERASALTDLCGTVLRETFFRHPDVQ